MNGKRRQRDTDRVKDRDTDRDKDRETEIEREKLLESRWGDDLWDVISDCGCRLGRKKTR
jgi:hypothetical protein